MSHIYTVLLLKPALVEIYEKFEKLKEALSIKFFQRQRCCCIID